MTRHPLPSVDFDGIANDVMPILMRYSDTFSEWTLEYPGFVALQLDGGGVWCIGTSNGTWSAELYIFADSLLNGESPDHVIDTYIRADCDNPNVIAEALYKAMSEVR